MRLKELRKEKKLSQEQIAKILSVTQRAYGGYELETSEPSIQTLCNLADYYNVSLDYLVGRERKDEVGFLSPTQITCVNLMKQLNYENLLILSGRIIAMIESQN